MKRRLAFMAVVFVLTFLIASVRFDTETMVCPPGRNCVFNVGIYDASVDKICFREIGHDAFLACKDVGSGVPLRIMVAAVRPGAGPLVFEAISIDADRSPRVRESKRAKQIGLMQDQTWPAWKTRAYVALKTMHFEW